MFITNWKIEKPSVEELSSQSKDEYYHSNNKKCEICNVEFNYGKQQWKNCKIHKIFVACKICNIEFELNIEKYSGTSRSYIYNAILNKENLECFCSRVCQNENLKILNDERKINKTGWYSKESIKAKNNSEFQTLRNLNAVKSGNNGLMRLPQREKDDPKFAKIMFNARKHNALLAKESKMKSGNCTRCGNYSEKRNPFGLCLKCSKEVSFNSSFITKDDILHYFDKAVLDYVPWIDFKEKFKTKNAQTPDGFSTITTFRSQDSNDWSGSRSAFEQSLIEMNIKYFVYIKYYYDKNNEIKGLVAGKSGSLLVNSSGSDVSYSTHEDHGPARKFLIEEKLDWCKTQISIFNCNSEIEAIELERCTQIENGLFGS